MACSRDNCWNNLVTKTMHYITPYHTVFEQAASPVEEKKPELPFILPSPINLAYFSMNAPKQPKTAPAPASVYNSVKSSISSQTAVQMNALYSGLYSPMKQAMLKSFSLNHLHPVAMPIEGINSAFEYPMPSEISFRPAPIATKKKKRGISKRTSTGPKLSSVLTGSVFSDQQATDRNANVTETPTGNQPLSLTQVMLNLDNANVTFAQLKEIASMFGIDRSGKKQELLDKLRRAANLSPVDLASVILLTSTNKSEPSPAASLSSLLNLDDLIEPDRSGQQSTSKPTNLYDFSFDSGPSDHQDLDDRFTSQLLNFSPILSFCNDGGISQNSKDSSFYNSIFQ